MKNLFISLSLFISMTSFAQITIEDVTMPASIKVGTETLQLNGAGLREKLFLDLYVGALYLKQKSTDANAIINNDEPMTIKLEIVSGLISSDKMTEAIDEGLEKSTKGKVTQFSKETTEFKDAFKETITEGDNYEITYLPNKGIVVSKNGKEVKTIACDLAFKKAVFGIWLCDDPADEDLKEGMLKG